MSVDQYLATYNDRDWQMAADGTVRVAVIGLGWWTTEFAMPAVDDAEFCETTAVVSSSTEKTARVAESTETVERALTYDEFHDGVGADAYDAVYNLYAERAAPAVRRDGGRTREGDPL